MKFTSRFNIGDVVDTLSSTDEKNKLTIKEIRYTTGGVQYIACLEDSETLYTVIEVYPIPAKLIWCCYPVTYTQGVLFQR